MSQGFWIGVVHLGMAETMARAGFASFSHGKRTSVEKPATGDAVVLYAPKTDLDGDPVQKFVALGVITGDTAREARFPGTDLTCWMRDAAWETITPMPVRPMLEVLTFVKNPRHWGMAFRRSLFQIQEADFTKIANALRKT